MIKDLCSGAKLSVPLIETKVTNLRGWHEDCAVLANVVFTHASDGAAIAAGTPEGPTKSRGTLTE